MYGGSAKLGRGGGRGSKRNNSPYPPPPLHRSIPPQSGRLSIGGGGGSALRNRQITNNVSPASKAPLAAPEETFNLVSGDPLAFAMIIRLAPNLVDEIRRVEAQGGTAKIKFDPYANNPAGNIIDVGGKDFRFTWSHEPGDLCDIYEERQSGEKGSGLLVESGGAWRKLNVQRVLDESTKNHVKMRSEEAERKFKSRKAIVLENGNPSVNNQMKTPATAALEGRMAPKPRKEPPFKKRKVEPPQASGGPPKSVYRPSTTTVKGRLSVSPVPSPPEQSRRSASPFGLGNLSRGQISMEEVIAPQVTSKEENSNTEKEIHSRVVHPAVHPGKKDGVTASPVDLRSMVVTLLTENPKGLGIKALEKAVGDSTMKIKPILEKIATYQAPGRYILKEGVDLESFKKPVSDSASSPECLPDQAANLEKASPTKFEHQSQLSPQLEISKLVEKIDNQQNSPDLFGDKKASTHNVERAGSSSDSGSGSDSDSDTDSGSDSGSQSRSRSKSPAGSGSGSSSDSESDGSSSNKQGSDVDVDIMTSDDEKGENKHKVHNIEPVLSISPLPWKSGRQNELNGANEDKQASQVYNAIGISKESPMDAGETGLVDITDSTPLRENVRYSQERMPFSPDRNHKGESQQFSAENFTNKRQNKEDVGLEHYTSSERISSSMMSSGLEYFDEKSGSGRRMKAGRSAQPMTFGRNKETMFARSPNYLSPNRPPLDPSKDRNLQAMDRVGDATADAGLQRGCDLSMPGRSHSDAQQSSQRHADLRTPGNAPDVMERPNNSVQNPGRNNKNFGRGLDFQDESDGSAFRSNHAFDKFSTNNDKVNTETLDDNGHAYGKSFNKNVRQGAVGDKTAMPFKSEYRKQGEQLGKLKDAQQTTNPHFDAFPHDGSRIDAERSSAVNGRGSLLRRELSELELGEFREPTHGEENQGSKKKFEKKNSFKLSESVSNASEHLRTDSNKVRATGKVYQELRKQLSPESGVGVFGNHEDSYWKRIVGDDIAESTRPQQTTSLPEVHQFPRVDHAEPEIGFEPNKPADKGTKSRKSESRKSQGMGPEGSGGTSKKASVNVPQQHGTENEGGKRNPKTIKENKSRKSNSFVQLTNRKDKFWTENSNSSQKRRELSVDEDNCAYFKYEKDEPELKGPIKDFSQYKEYVLEYREKYGTYCSLNKSLETYRTDFSKLGHDLQLAKDRDIGEYHNILEQLRENYRLCGKRHKRLKKIFLVLHEELKCLKKSIKDFAVSYAKD